MFAALLRTIVVLTGFAVATPAASTPAATAAAARFAVAALLGAGVLVSFTRLFLVAAFSAFDARRALFKALPFRARTFRTRTIVTALMTSFVAAAFGARPFAAILTAALAAPAAALTARAILFAFVPGLALAAVFAARDRLVLGFGFFGFVFFFFFFFFRLGRRDFAHRLRGTEGGRFLAFGAHGFHAIQAQIRRNESRIAQHENTQAVAGFDAGQRLALIVQQVKRHIRMRRDRHFARTLAHAFFLKHAQRMHGGRFRRTDHAGAGTMAARAEVGFDQAGAQTLT
jgi:hypothetical protein